MKSILYIGNKLNNKKSNLSSISTLGLLFQREGYKVYYASSKTNKIIRMLDMLFACLVNCKRVDYVIIDTYSTTNFYYAFLVSQLCRLLRVKYIASLNGGNLPNRLQRSPKLSNCIFKNSFKNVSPSWYLVQAFKLFGYPNVVFIPNTIEIEKYKFKEREFDCVNLLWVRSFSKIYNPSLAIKTLKNLRDEGIDAKLCMVGPDSDGSMEEAKELANKLKVEVKFTGKLLKEEWISLSEEYNIFINTTNFDNMPVSVIEAMALGLCVVSTNVGGLPFLLEDQKDGILVAPNNMLKFSNAIRQVINHPVATKAMVFNARQKVERFDWDYIKHKWFEVLE